MTAPRPYDRRFYRYIREGALASAAAVVPVLTELLRERHPVRSVLDVGCGAGAWLSAWKRAGAEVRGLDGDYVDRAELLIEEAEFQPTDLRRPFDLGRRFDLVQCLEVAEHLEPEAGAQLVESLCRHGDLVLFSAAPPGQGGEHHVNEQPYAHWRDRFAAQGFALHDPVRPSLVDNAKVRPWYRYNTFLYLRREADTALHDHLAPWRVDPALPPPDISPPLYRLRKRLLAPLPPPLVTALARARKHLPG